MGLEEIIGEIESETSKKLSEMRQKARAEESGIIGAAKAEVKRISDDAEDRAADSSRSILSREVSKAEMEAKGIYNKAVNDSLEDALEQIRASFSDYRKGKEYAQLMEKLVRLSARSLGEDCKVLVNGADRKLVPSKGKMKVEADDARVPDGLVAYSADGRRFVDYTLRNILEGSRDSVAAELLKQIKSPDRLKGKAKVGSKEEEEEEK